MKPFNHDYLLNMGISITSVIFSLGFGLILFVVVVLIEARIMERYYNLTKAERLKYAALINTISTLIGIPLAFLVDRQAVLSRLFYMFGAFNFWLYLLAFILTIVIEYFSFLFLLRSWTPKRKTAILYTLHANVLSYLALVFIPLALSLFGTFLAIMLS